MQTEKKIQHFEQSKRKGKKYGYLPRLQMKSRLNSLSLLHFLKVIATLEAFIHIDSVVLDFPPTFSRYIEGRCPVLLQPVQCPQCRAEHSVLQAGHAGRERRGRA